MDERISPTEGQFGYCKWFVLANSVALNILAHIVEIIKFKFNKSKSIYILHFDRHCQTALQKDYVCFIFIPTDPSSPHHDPH